MEYMELWMINLDLLRNFFKRFIYLLFEREKERVNEQGRDKGRGRESPADSLLSTESDTGLDHTTLRS